MDDEEGSWIPAVPDAFTTRVTMTARRVRERRRRLLASQRSWVTFSVLPPLTVLFSFSSSEEENDNDDDDDDDQGDEDDDDDVGIT